jgi:DNA primase
MIPIDVYLERRGLSPAKTRLGGRELWYHSPIRDGDNTPSFKVDTKKNVWFDHGLVRGGNIIDLVREFYQCNVSQALAMLESTGLYNPYQSTFPRTASPSPRQEQLEAKQAPAGEKEKMVAFELVSSGAIKHPALLQYLESRGIQEQVARKYLSQISFRTPGGLGTYFSLGYPAGTGFEARNAQFKGFVGTGKDITVHDVPGASLLQVFEGFMDFLTYLTLKKRLEPEGTVIVLNSTNLWRRALPYIDDPRFEKVRLYLDNDDAGNAATKAFIEHAGPDRLADMREHYADADDLNAWHLARRH